MVAEASDALRVHALECLLFNIECTTISIVIEPIYVKDHEFNMTAAVTEFVLDFNFIKF